MDFLEDLLDFGDRKRRKNGGFFQNTGNHHDDDHDDHDHYQQNQNQAPVNSPFSLNQQFPENPAVSLAGVNCPKCSRPTMQGAKFCHACGTAIGMVLNCASCGSKLPANAAFCPQCGYNNKG